MIVREGINHVPRGTIHRPVKIKKAGDIITDLFANLFEETKLI
jgi:hypothetical protein